MWNAQSFQIVWFPVSVEGLSAKSIFENLLDREPDTTETSRVPSQKTPFFSRSLAEINALRHVIVVAPGRVDWHIEPVLDEDESPYSRLFNSVETVEFVMKRVVGLPPETIGDVNRVSVISTLLRPMSSFEETSSEFVAMTGLPVVSEGAMDLSLQINKRKLISGGVSINRLVKFSTETLSRLVINLDAQQGKAASAAPSNEELFSVKVRLDFNTVPTGQIFDKDRQIEIFGCLCDETLKMAESPGLGFYK
ncbi:hypothetical protein [Roseovarius indicus]|uniref:hypothetical protein n=1 Tax=Roseovarius indicus TaxID=540747 RepID=UPI0032EE73F5